MKYVVYNEVGKIVRFITCPDNLAESQIGAGESLLLYDDSVNADDVLHYVDVNKKIIMTRLPYTHKAEAGQLCVTITGLPSGAMIEVMGGSVVVDGSPTTISFDVPGSYRLHISGPMGFLEETMEVIING